MPGGQIAGYRIDTGLDIAGSPREVFAIASGTLDYSEPGHTRWTGPNDTANCVRLRLDRPIQWNGHRITHVWYAHLSSLRWVQAEGAAERIHVEGGEVIGVSGKARGMPHLHLGMLVDDQVEQAWGTYLLEDDIRQVLGSYRNFTRLPPMPERAGD
jgi:murein DD-endopeptidase MepM/ murein hydrolase activator NlpD